MTGMGNQRSDAMYSRLEVLVGELIRLLDRLEEEIPYKPKLPAPVGGAPRGGHGPLASWNTPAAMLVLEIHAGVRELETSLRHRLTGIRRVRGSSTENTVRALENLPALCAGSDVKDCRIVLQTLDAWSWKARLVLGDDEPFSRLPRMVGQSEPLCPYCHRTTLRYRPYSGRVRCISPDCRDINGRKPEGRLETGDYSGEASLAWNDGTTGVHERPES